MGGIHAVVVGYPLGDPRIPQLWAEHGHRALPHRGCISCGVLVYYVPSGQDAIMGRDAEPVCERCWARPDVQQSIYAAL